MGFVGNWHASSGGYAGQYGNSVYMIVGTTGASATTYIVGYYCYVDQTTLERTSCGFELYTVDSANANADNCPSQYKLDGTLNPLYTFASTGATNTDSGSGGNKTAVAMAILFGVLCGILMLLLGGQYVMHNRDKPLLSHNTSTAGAEMRDVNRA